MIKNCDICNNPFKDIFKKHRFCEPCRKQLHQNIMSLVESEELTGTPIQRATARRLYEQHYKELQL